MFNLYILHTELTGATNNYKFVSALWGIVVGHYSSNGNVKEDHVNIDQ